MEPWLTARARRTPDATALETTQRALTFAELAERADAVARRLIARGAAPRARVALLGEPTLRTIEIVHAMQRVGAALVPLNTRLARPEIEALVSFTRPSLVLHDARHAALAPAGSIEMERELDATAPAPGALRNDVDPGETHSIVFTSGTTGKPKGAMLTHGAHRASAEASAQRLGTTGADRWLVCMPLFHVGGLSIVLRSALTGFAIVLEERFDEARVNRAIHQRGVTTISVVPTMLDRLLESAAGRPYPASLRCALVGGAPLKPALHARARGAGIPLAPTYGLTETGSQVATAEPSAVALAPGVGRPLDGVEVRTARPDPSGVGEVLVKGPIVMRGYFENEAATRAVMAGGWLSTADLGRLDRDGRLAILGRRSDLIITGGENVLPEEVEGVISSHPGVSDVAVFGMPDQRWGERVTAAVVASGEIDDAALRAWCRERLAGYKVPARFVRVAWLPRNASGKLLRRQLRERSLPAR
jgi:O-succinylbenzoic acid--CoA ligase